jgi:hypothetical protein
MEFKTFEIEFDKDGHLFQPDRLAEAMYAIKDVSFTDLSVFSHGWNNDIADARQLYEDYFRQSAEVLQSGKVQGLGSRSFAVIAIFWPSKKFADEDLIPGGGAAAVDDGKVDQNIVMLLDELKRDPVRLGQYPVNPVSAAAVENAKALLPRLETDSAARREFVLQLRSMLNPGSAHPDDASEEFFTADPELMFRKLSEPVLLPQELTAAGGAADLAADVAGFFGDLATGIKAAARRLLNYTTYYQMKDRSGNVGRTGLAPVLSQLRQEFPDIKIHLIGHSFGGRLVTAAAHALDDGTTVDTLTLLQAAYSHNGLAAKFDGTHDGAFRSMIVRHRVRGPICISYTHNDKAVGILYPLASRLAGDEAAALGDANDPYGGMGRNGAQRTPEAQGRNVTLTRVGDALRLERGKVHNLECSGCIFGHSDIAKPPVAYATLSAAAIV